MEYLKLAGGKYWTFLVNKAPVLRHRSFNGKEMTRISFETVQDGQKTLIEMGYLLAAKIMCVVQKPEAFRSQYEWFQFLQTNAVTDEMIQIGKTVRIERSGEGRDMMYRVDAVN